MVLGLSIIFIFLLLIQIPLDNASIGPVHLTINPDPSTVHRFISTTTEARTSTSRMLLCEARNDQGQVQDGHFFRVLKPGGSPVGLGSLVRHYLLKFYYPFSINPNYTFELSIYYIIYRLRLTTV